MNSSLDNTSWRKLIAAAEEAEDVDPLAEETYKAALSDAELSLGNEHPDVATVVIYLADFYMFFKRFVEAELLYKRALKIYQKKFGEEHMLVAMTLRNLAEVREAQGSVDEATSLRKKARAIFG